MIFTLDVVSVLVHSFESLIADIPSLASNAPKGGYLIQNNMIRFSLMQWYDISPYKLPFLPHHTYLPYETGYGAIIVALHHASSVLSTCCLSLPFRRVSSLRISYLPCKDVYMRSCFHRLRSSTSTLRAVLSHGPQWYPDGETRGVPAVSPLAIQTSEERTQNLRLCLFHITVLCRMCFSVFISYS